MTLSGWVIKLGTWWDDGREQNFYVGDKDTKLSSNFQISGSAQIAAGWSSGTRSPSRFLVRAAR